MGSEMCIRDSFSGAYIDAAISPPAYTKISRKFSDASSRAWRRSGHERRPGRSDPRRRNEEANVEPLANAKDVFHPLRSAKIGVDHPRLDCVRSGELGRQCIEHFEPSRDQYEVEPTLGEAARELSANPVGSPGHDRPRPIALTKSVRSLVRTCAIDRYFHWARSFAAFLGAAVK